MMNTREPALWIGAIAAVFALLVGYGLDPIVANLWKALAIALIPVAQAVLTRSQVTPTSKLDDAGISTAQLDVVADDPTRSFKVVAQPAPR